MVRAASRRQRAEQAALAAQHVIDLEEEFEQLKRERDDYRLRAERAEAACINLHEDVASAKAERDKYQLHAIEIMTKLQVSAKVILDAMQSPLAQQACD